MFEKPSLVTRIAVGKLGGFIFGGLGFFLLPIFVPEMSLMTRGAFLLWYVSLGAIVGMAGPLTYHPILKIKLHWWWRDAVICAWFNFLLCLFIFEEMQGMMTAIFGAEGLFQSPYWFAVEGAFFGLIIGYFANRFGGEGPER